MASLPIFNYSLAFHFINLFRLLSRVFLRSFVHLHVIILDFSGLCSDVKYDQVTRKALEHIHCYLFSGFNFPHTLDGIIRVFLGWRQRTRARSARCLHRAPDNQRRPLPSRQTPTAVAPCPFLAGRTWAAGPMGNESHSGGGARLQQGRAPRAAGGRGPRWGRPGGGGWPWRRPLPSALAQPQQPSAAVGLG